MWNQSKLKYEILGFTSNTFENLILKHKFFISVWKIR